MHLFKIFLLLTTFLNNYNFQISKNESELTDPVKKIIYEDFENYQLTTGINDDFITEYVNLLVKLKYDCLPFYEINEETERSDVFESLKDYYCENNNKKIQKLNLGIFDEYYVSKYSPYLSINIKLDESIDENIMMLAYQNDVECIYVNNVVNNEETINSSTSFIGLSDYISENQCDATGVTIGILEPGVLDETNNNFEGMNVTVRDEWYYIESIDQHTTMMASVITGKNGIAKNCNLLSVELCGDAVSEIDWLLDNGVNVINCSYGDKNPNGEYSSKSAYMDFISSTYKVTIVASSGNTGDTNSYVANPGLGYNVITVGACSSTSGNARNFSSYEVVEGPRKPNIVAPGYNVSVPGFSGSYSGTSLSSAIVTGCVAILMNIDNSLKVHPERVASRLYAYSHNPNSLYFGSGFDDYVGSGVINFDDILSMNNERNFYLSSANNLATFSLNLNEGDEFRLITSCLAYSNGKANGTSFSDYNVYLYDSNNNLIASEITNIDTLELLEIRINKTDLYNIKIIRNNDMPFENEYISVNYCIR